MRSTEDGSSAIYGLRKRRRGRAEDSGEPRPLDKLLAAAEGSRRIIVFSGSGLSATSGMSTFSTKGGLYEKAQRKFKLSDGKMLFTYTFFDRRRLEAQAFFADIYLEAMRAAPAPGHHALSSLLAAGRLHRHYTLNIDGLAGMVGMDTWHPETNPSGVTVEMHGNVRLLVCVECGATLPLTPPLVRQLKAQQPVPCGRCSHGAMRFKVMMYEDAESEAITPEEVMDLMEDDVKACDLILWVGISFQQSASTSYFRNVRRWLQEADRLEEVLQAVINPSDEALWNLMTASSNQANLNVLEVLAESDDVLPELADRLARLPRIARQGALGALEQAQLASPPQQQQEEAQEQAQAQQTRGQQPAPAPAAEEEQEGGAPANGGDAAAGGEPRPPPPQQQPLPQGAGVVGADSAQAAAAAAAAVAAVAAALPLQAWQQQWAAAGGPADVPALAAAGPGSSLLSQQAALAQLAAAGLLPGMLLGAAAGGLPASGGRCAPPGVPPAAAAAVGAAYAAAACEAHAMPAVDVPQVSGGALQSGAEVSVAAAQQ